PTRGRSSRDPAGAPSTSTVLERTSWTPTIARISVDLPQPLGPSNPVMRPGTTLSEMPCSTRAPPRSTTRSLTSTAFIAESCQAHPPCQGQAWRSAGRGPVPGASLRNHRNLHLDHRLDALEDVLEAAAGDRDAMVLETHHGLRRPVLVADDVGDGNGQLGGPARVV